LEGDEGDPSLLDAVFPEISEKMKEIRPVYTAYFHSDDWQAPGENTTVDEVFKLLKMENIATHEGYQQISPDLIVNQEPDLIIADSVESVVENPALAGLHMVQDTAHIPHHIFVLREGYSFYVAAPGFRDTVKAFAAFAYPDTFTIGGESVDGHGDGHEEAGHDHGDDHSHGH
jgi:ABC-type Fe3+-hydroxamate transport system substrate-binding protein